MNTFLVKPSEALRKKFPFEPTQGQLKLFTLLDHFIPDKEAIRPTLLIRGYAGTGKTTVVTSLVNILKYYDYKSILLAPTGRAAKVMAQYAGRKAFTIHKIIFKLQDVGTDQKMKFVRQKNYLKNTLFIVDEASMLSDQADFGNDSLLADLVNYVFENKTNKLILIGDNAQLPPVGQSDSPAFHSEKMVSRFGLDLKETTLTEVMRQELDSGILSNATALRNQISLNQPDIQFRTKAFSDIFRVSGEKMEDGLRYAYDKFGVENTAIICRSNRQAVQYNQYIRNAIFFYENEIEAGDFLMIIRNNYTVLTTDSHAGFLANGDFVEVMKIVSFEEVYGFRFATVELRLVDYADEPHFETKILLNTLYSYTTSLTQEEYRKLYDEVILDYEDSLSKKEQMKAIKNDPYLNALQVKFSYAITCHKSQGGQWKAVFLDQGYLKDDMINVEYLRWLYTGMTRATTELYLLNFHKKFFL